MNWILARGLDGQRAVSIVNKEFNFALDPVSVTVTAEEKPLEYPLVIKPNVTVSYCYCGYCNSFVNSLVYSQ